jgi:hypothetical protein
MPTALIAAATTTMIVVLSTFDILIHQRAEHIMRSLTAPFPDDPLRPHGVATGNTHIEQMWAAQPPEPDSSLRAHIFAETAKGRPVN